MDGGCGEVFVDRQLHGGTESLPKWAQDWVVLVILFWTFWLLFHQGNSEVSNYIYGNPESLMDV